MSANPINTAPLQQFIQQTQSAEAGKSKEVRLTIEQAKLLSYTLGIVMSRLHGDLEKFVAAQTDKLQAEQVIQVSMDSGEWK
jgi:hypothetical protein